MGYLNPLLKLPAAQKLMEMPIEDRRRIAAVLRELRGQANDLAEISWKRKKGSIAVYWRVVATYSRHLAHALTREDREGPTRRRLLARAGESAGPTQRVYPSGIGAVDLR